MTNGGAPDSETMFGWIADDRRRIADVLSGLTADQLNQPSLCGGWTVDECAAHLTTGINLSWAKFGLAMLKARGNFDRANTAIAHDLATRGIDRTIRDLREQAEHRFTPPGAGPEAPLTDLMVHSEEMFRPLGIEQSYQPERVEAVLDQVLHPNFQKLMNGPSIDGLRLEAADIDWAAGTGELITGPGHSIVLLMTGRYWALEDLEGPGVASVRVP